MGIYSLKPAFQKSLMGTRDALVKAGVSPDAITYAALVFSILGGGALAISPGFRGALLTVPVFAIGRTALNALDGMVAKATGVARPFGEMLNEFLDRIADAVWFAGLALAIDPVLMLATLAGVLVSSYLGTAVKAAGGPRIYSGVMGKADRMIVLSVGAVFAFVAGLQILRYTTIFIAGGVAVTIVQRFLRGHNALRDKGSDAQ